MQCKLLRVLDERLVQRLGSSRAVEVDMRVIAASNVNLQDLLAQKKLRKDFYYRINVISIELLSLRKRLEGYSATGSGFSSSSPSCYPKRDY